MTPIRRNLLDIAILTAVPIEVLAALKIFGDDYENMGGFHSYSEKEYYENDLNNGLSPNIFHIGYIPVGKKRYSVLVYQLVQYGSSDMSSVASIISERWNPRYYFLTGIAMAFRNNAEMYKYKPIKLGDIIVADKALCAKEKRHVGKTSDIVLKNIDLNPELFQSTLKKSSTTKIVIDEGDKQTVYRLKIHQGCIHSSDDYLASTNETYELYQRIRKAKCEPLGHEMELSGFLSGAATEIRGIKDKLVFVKGVSDYGDDQKKDTKWRYIAATHSAMFVKRIISEGSLVCGDQEVSIDEDVYRKLTMPEYKNWLGEMQYRQGLFKKAEPNFDKAWQLLINANSDIPNKKAILSRVANNISEIKLEQGKISEALSKSMISLQISSEFSNQLLKADCLFNVGRTLREAEIVSLSKRFLDQAKKLNEAISKEDNILGIKIKLWSGYILYKQQKFMEAYDLIQESYDDLYQLDPENRSYRILYSEITDKLGRCVRELAKDRDNVVLGINSKILQNNQETLIMEALHCYYLGYLSAEKEGNYYRKAESCLSYVIIFTYKNLQSILIDILQKRDSYAFQFITSKKESGLVYNQNFLNFLEGNIMSNASKFYKEGIGLCERWNYGLLKCLFLKYRAEHLLNISKVAKSFEKSAEGYVASFGGGNQVFPVDHRDYPNEVSPSVRPQEMYISFSEINEKLFRYEVNQRRNYIRLIKDSLERQGHSNDVLFSTDYFKALLGDL